MDRAWGRIHRQYNRRTISRLMRIQIQCLHPKVVKLNELVRSVMVWENMWTQMMAEHPAGTKIPESWRMAALMHLCPKEIVDALDTRWDEIGENYEALKQKVVAWASNKMEKTNGAVPMDIGDLRGKQDREGSYDDNYWEDAEVDGVGDGDYNCRNCGGYGHYARDCPTKGKSKGKGWDKGKGKGFYKGKGDKGYGKGWGKQPFGYYQKGDQKGKGDKGKGKGYQGVCWNCGKVGHKANECHAKGMHHVHEEEFRDEPVGVEGMEEVYEDETWTIGNVGETDPSLDGGVPPGLGGGPWREVSTGGWRSAARRGKPKCCTHEETFRVGTHNRFAELEEHPMEIGGTDTYEIGEVRAGGEQGWTRLSSVNFNLAGVCKPLISAAEVVAKGNKIVMDPDPEKSHIENLRTGERMKLRMQKGVFVIDVKYQNGEEGPITLDSGAGVSVFPKTWAKYAEEVGPRKPGLKMIAANGTAIENIGRAKVVLRGRKPLDFSGPSR